MLLCQVLSSCGGQGLLSVAVHGLLILLASLVEAHRPAGFRSRSTCASVIAARGLVVVVHRLSCSVTCEPGPPAFGVQSLSRWTVREVPDGVLIHVDVTSLEGRSMGEVKLYGYKILNFTHIGKILTVN